MQVNLIKDAHGQVQGSFETSGATGAQLKPKLGEAKFISTVELPDDYAKKPAEIYKSHRPAAK